MSDHTVTAPAAASAAAAEATVAAYLESWNETDPARRQAAIARAWGPRARYRDPLMASDGAAGIDSILALSAAEGLAAVQARFPGFMLKRISAVDAHNGSARFAWSLGPESAPSAVEGSISARSIRRDGWRAWWGSTTKCEVPCASSRAIARDFV